MRVDVLVGGVADDDRLADIVEDRVGRHETFLERACHRDHLVRRPRLVHDLGGLVLLRRGRRTRGLIGARAVDGRHRDDVAGQHVGDDGHPALRARGLHLLGEHVLGVRLDRLVEREHEILPALCTRDGVATAWDLVPVGVTLDARLARASAQRLLVSRLEAAEPVVVGTHEAEHRRRQRARRVEPLRFRLVRQPREAERLHTRDGGVVDRARDVREPALLIRQPRRQRGLVDADEWRERRRVRVRVLDDVGVGDDRRLRYRQREVDAVAVEDAAALGRNGDGLHALADAQ